MKAIKTALFLLLTFSFAAYGSLAYSQEMPEEEPQMRTFRKFESIEEEEEPMFRTFDKSSIETLNLNTAQTSSLLTSTKYANWTNLKTQVLNDSNYFTYNTKWKSNTDSLKQALSQADSLLLEIKSSESKILSDPKLANSLLTKLSSYEAMIRSYENDLQSVGDDAQLANIDLQNWLQKQQQMMQMLSNMLKIIHDTQMAIIRKLG